jgi:hypothetical protein
MALMDIHKHLVAEVAALVEIVQQPLLLLVVLVVMADYLLAAVVVVGIQMLELAAEVAMAAMVWFVFILGNQL